MPSFIQTAIDEKKWRKAKRIVSKESGLSDTKSARQLKLVNAVYHEIRAHGDSKMLRPLPKMINRMRIPMHSDIARSMEIPSNAKDIGVNIKMAENEGAIVDVRWETPPLKKDTVCGNYGSAGPFVFGNTDEALAFAKDCLSKGSKKKTQLLKMKK